MNALDAVLGVLDVRTSRTRPPYLNLAAPLLYKCTYDQDPKSNQKPGPPKNGLGTVVQVRPGPCGTPSGTQKLAFSEICARRVFKCFCNAAATDLL